MKMLGYLVGCFIYWPQVIGLIIAAPFLLLRACYRGRRYGEARADLEIAATKQNAEGN